jgi:hypothetical protein
MDQTKSLKKALLWTGLIVISLIILVWLVIFLNSGTIIITTSNPQNEISLVKHEEGDEDKAQKSAPKIYKAKGKLEVRVNRGKYIATVTGNSVGTTQLIELSSHKTLTYKIDPISTTGVEPVTFVDSQNITVNSTQLLYLNNTTNSLTQISQDNSVTTIGGHFQTIQWADNSFGVGQNNAGQLFTISNGTINDLKVPFQYGTQTINYAVSPNKKVYVSNGSTVYAGDQNGNLKKIFTANTNRPSLSASSSQLLVNDNSGEGAGEPHTTLVSTDGKIIRKELEIGVAVWSADGKFLATADEKGANVYDNSLKSVAIIPSDIFISNLAWLDDDTLFYNTSDQLWIYKVSEQKSQILANMPLGSSITGLALNADKSYLYFTTNGTDGTNAIRRIGLKGQQNTPQYIYDLQNIMPISLNDVSLNLVNFGHPPTVLINPHPDSSLSPQAYMQEAQTELQQDGFNLSQLKLVLGQPGS